MTLLLVISSILFAAPVPDEIKYSGEAEKIRLHFNDLFDASKKVNSPKEKGAARTKIENALDWEQVGEGCMGKKHWSKATPKNRTDFSSLLKDVVLRTAFTRLDKFWDGASPRFEKIDVNGVDAHIVCRFYFPTESFTLDYYLKKKNNKWLIHDLAYEDLRYSENINEQIAVFLKEHTMAELIDKLRKRREELNKT